MELIKAIYTRQSIGKVRPDPIPRSLIEQILDAAATAPNHRRLRPWRFVVLTGNARLRLGELMAQALLKQNAGASLEQLEAERGKSILKMFALVQRQSKICFSQLMIWALEQSGELAVRSKMRT